MEWLLPYYWAAAVDPTGRWGEPAPGGGVTGPDDLDLVRIAFGVLVEEAACGVCGASLDPAIGVRRSRSPFTAARIVVVACCRGPRRHRHRATVVERAGDLRFGCLRPARP